MTASRLRDISAVLAVVSYPNAYCMAGMNFGFPVGKGWIDVTGNFSSRSAQSNLTSNGIGEVVVELGKGCWRGTDTDLRSEAGNLE